jgi:hypothetical protein
MASGTAKDARNGEGASAEQRLRALYERSESSAAEALEHAVGNSTFGTLLARSAENVAALSRISSEFGDLVLRNLRLAGRADISRLSRQLHRTEDKLERVLQEVEELREELRDQKAAAGATAGAKPDGRGEDRTGGP